MGRSMKLAAVIVTYNRITLLEEVLDAFDHQTRIPDYVIIVDNASTDGTHDLLQRWKLQDIGNEKIVITSDKNLGGSGGFYIGTKRAIETDADWVWVSDDDAIPEKDVFEKAERHIAELSDTENVSAVCTAVYTDGKIIESNRSRRLKTFFDIKITHIDTAEYTKPSFECNEFSYVGVLMNKKKLEEVGLIHAEYFIWRDDVEHSWRLSEVGKIICYPDMIVDHKANVVDYSGVSWKTFYAYRNDMLMLLEHESKRYFFAKALKAHIHSIKTKDQKQKRIYLDAIKYAKKNKTGLNPDYAPGMKF